MVIEPTTHVATRINNYATGHATLVPATGRADVSKLRSQGRLKQLSNAYCTSPRGYVQTKAAGRMLGKTLLGGVKKMGK